MGYGKCFAGLIILASLAIAGCVSKPFVNDPLGRDELSSGARVGILPLNYLEKPEVNVNDNPVGLAGTAGKLALIKGRDTKRRKFSAALDGLEYRYQQQLDETLLARLESAGIDAEFLAFRRSIDNILEAVPPRRFEKRYPEDSGYDALLDIYVDYAGYAAQALGDPYLPTVHIAARIVDGTTLDTLYESRIQYNPLEDVTGESTIEADSDYAFENFDALIEDVPRARDGLRNAVDAVLDRLVEELKVF